MKKTIVYVYFTLLGDNFDADYVTQTLGIQPTAIQNPTDLLKTGKACGYTAWETEVQQEESTNIAIQVDKAIAPFLDKASLLDQLRQECNAEWKLTIVIYVEDDEPPFMGFTREQMKFLGSIETEIEFDMYILSDRGISQHQREMEKKINSIP